jgi:hypothetical protein
MGSIHYHLRLSPIMSRFLSRPVPLSIVTVDADGDLGVEVDVGITGVIRENHEYGVEEKKYSSGSYYKSDYLGRSP